MSDLVATGSLQRVESLPERIWGSYSIRSDDARSFASPLSGMLQQQRNTTVFEGTFSDTRPFSPTIRFDGYEQTARAFSRANRSGDGADGL